LTDTVAVYFINEGYLLPAMVSAIQARKFSSRELVDVLIVCAGSPTDNGRKAIAVATKNDVEIIYVPVSVLEDKPPTYGRLIVHRILPEKYKRIIYIDGDTQVAGPLDPLATAPLAPGKFMAVRDPGQIFSQLSPDWRKAIEADYRSGGYTGAFDGYFNAGVLVMNRDGWPELADCTMALYDKAERTKHLDQDLMNRAVSGHCIRISNRWNFPGFLIGSPMETAVKPVIYHFMSNPRPWNEAVKPWGKKWMQPYDRLLKENPELSFLTPKPTLTSHIKYVLMQHYKYVREYSRVGKMKELPPELDV
jgi:lipopolysaccharide biosynthesis glycosyltransferase